MQRGESASILIAAAAVLVVGGYAAWNLVHDLRTPAPEPLAAEPVAAKPRPADPAVQPVTVDDDNPATALDPPVRQPIKTEAEGRADGEREAKEDLAKGVLGWRTFGGWGYPARLGYDQVDMSEVLADDFDVTLKRVHAGGGCMVPRDHDYQAARRDAYNELMTPALKQRRGADVLTVAEKRANERTRSNKQRFEQIERQCKAGSKTACAKAQEMQAPLL